MFKIRYSYTAILIAFNMPCLGINTSQRASGMLGSPRRYQTKELPGAGSV